MSIEDNASHKRRLVRKYERTLGISWAPDSHLFFVNDMYASNGTLVYIHDPVTLKTTDLADMIVAADPHAAGFLKAGHSYLEAKSWLNSRELLVVLYGHFDESPPARGFNLQYRVGIDGSVHRLSQRTREKP